MYKFTIVKRIKLTLLTRALLATLETLNLSLALAEISMSSKITICIKCSINKHFISHIQQRQVKLISRLSGLILSLD
jgi:hypothetical protein